MASADFPVDLSGLVFGQLTVFGRLNNLWRCRCVCGEDRHVTRSNLVDAKSTSCGRHRIDMRGRRFGRLEVVDFGVRPGERRGRVYWKYVCRCGKVVAAVDAISLRQGHVRSCGCLRDELRAGL
jgi:hypothetical protein